MPDTHPVIAVQRLWVDSERADHRPAATGRQRSGQPHPPLPGFAADSNDDDPPWTAAATAAPCVRCGWPAFCRAPDGRPRHRVDCSTLPPWQPGAKLPQGWGPSAVTHSAERAR